MDLDEVALTGELSRMGGLADRQRADGAGEPRGARGRYRATANGNEAAVVDDFEVFTAETYDCVKLLESDLRDEPVRV